MILLLLLELFLAKNIDRVGFLLLLWRFLMIFDSFVQLIRLFCVCFAINENVEVFRIRWTIQKGHVFMRCDLYTIFLVMMFLSVTCWWSGKAIINLYNNQNKLKMKKKNNSTQSQSHQNHINRIQNRQPKYILLWKNTTNKTMRRYIDFIQHGLWKKQHFFFAWNEKKIRQNAMKWHNQTR